MAEGNVMGAGASFAKLATEVAFEAVRAEMLALGEGELLRVNIDVGVALTTVIGALPEIRELRPALVRELPLFDVARFDRLETYALALSHAQARYRTASTSPVKLQALGAELSAHRDRMLGATQALVGFGLLDGARLREFKKEPGYRPLVNEVLALVTLFKEHWVELENKTPVTRALLDAAGQLALELQTGVGLQEQAPVAIGEAAEQRARTFTLLIRAYDDVRRAASYLRANEGDVDEIAPSLYAKKASRSRGEADAEAETPPAPVAAAGTNGSTPPNGNGDDIVVDNRAGFPITHPLTH